MVKTIENFKNTGITVTVTTEHSSSSYGVPVVVFGGIVYGDLETVTIPERLDDYGDVLEAKEITAYEIKLMIAHGDEENEIMKGAIIPQHINEKNIAEEKATKDFFGDLIA